MSAAGPRSGPSAEDAGVGAKPALRRRPALRDRLSALRVEAYALLLAARDPRVPWFAKAVVVAVLAYAASPIDLIPDFIPVLGFLDDLLIVPAGVALARRLIPRDVLEEHRARARERFER